jgi:hypothetical protein
LDLLRYCRNGEIPAIESPSQQARVLTPLGRLLQMEGWKIGRGMIEGSDVPLIAADPKSGTELAIGVYPALVDYDSAQRAHPLSKVSSHDVLLLPDYLVSRDLPSAYQVSTGGSFSRSEAPQMAMVEIPSSTLASLAAGGDGTHNTVRLPVTSTGGTVAVQTSSSSLGRIGVGRGSWLVLRPAAPLSDTNAERLLVSRRNGIFKASGQAWTIGFVRKVADADGVRLQISYGRRESQFRPERLIEKDVTVLGAVLEVIDPSLAR